MAACSSRPKDRTLEIEQRVPQQNSHALRHQPHQMSELNNEDSERTLEDSKSRKRSFGACNSTSAADASQDRTSGNDGKRVRTLEWPLTSPADDGKTLPGVSIAIDRSSVSAFGSSGFCAPRSSRFLEGDMNGHISKKPASSYIEAAKASFFESSEETKGDQVGLSKHIGSVPQVTTSESSMFRLGRSLAVTLNPMHWKIWSRTHSTQSEDGGTMDLRKRRAEAIYEDMKSSGQLHFVGSTISNRALKSSTILDRPPRKHDSGVALDHWRDGMVGFKAPILAPAIDQDADILVGQQQGNLCQDSTFISSTGHKVPLCAKTLEWHNGILPSGDLTSQTKDTSSDLAMSSSQQTDVPTRHTLLNMEGSNRLKHVPSRKDLQKQQRLVKRVSDLEAKLAAARRHLAEVLKEPVPPLATRRSPFVPGALPTLPSERLLHDAVTYEIEEVASLSCDDIGRAISLDVPFVELSTDQKAYDRQNSSIAIQVPRENPIQSMASVTQDSTIAATLQQSDESYQTATDPSKKSLGHANGKHSPPALESCLAQKQRDSERSTGRGSSSRKNTTPLHTGKVRIQSTSLQTSPPDAMGVPPLSSPTGQASARHLIHAIKDVNGLRSSPASTRRKSRCSVETAQSSNVSLIVDKDSMCGTGIISKETSQVQDSAESLASAGSKVADPDQVRKKSSVHIERCVNTDRSLPKCSACKQEFSTVGRLTAHVARTCRVLRARGAYDEMDSPVSQRTVGTKDERTANTPATNAEEAPRRVSVQQEDTPFEWPADVF